MSEDSDKKNSNHIMQTFSHGKTKTVVFETKKLKRGCVDVDKIIEENAKDKKNDTSEKSNNEEPSSDNDEDSGATSHVKAESVEINNFSQNKKARTYNNSNNTFNTKNDNNKKYKPHNLDKTFSYDNNITNMQSVNKAKKIILPEKIEISVPKDCMEMQTLAAQMKMKIKDLQTFIKKLGFEFSDKIDSDLAEIIITEVGHIPIRDTICLAEQLLLEPKGKDIRTRPPVVTIMGHVDHGKTSLLDFIRRTKVVAKEAGGITQHIGAYQASHNGKDITFIDTPGHAAFTQMRARGANITDIVVLVVAADDGVNKQTVEAIQHAKSANATIIVAINKIDKPEANIERVRTDLLASEIVVEKLGGTVVDVPLSAKTGANVDKLLESILIQAEMLEIASRYDKNARGTILEAHIEKGLGSVATILVQNGVLKVGDLFVSGKCEGKIRTMTSAEGKPIKQANPGTPVRISGISNVPNAGDSLIVLDSENEVKIVLEFVENNKKETNSNGMFCIEDDKKYLNIIIKADTHGSMEVLKHTISGMSDGEVIVKIINAAVGDVSENDINLADVSKANIICFNTKINKNISNNEKMNSIKIIYSNIIYKLIDDIKLIMACISSPNVVEHVIGAAEVRVLFHVKKLGTIAGCMVKSGIIKKNCFVKVIRNGKEMIKSRIASLQQNKENAKEVRTGFECGIIIDKNFEYKEGDMIECVEEKIEPAV